MNKLTGKIPYILYMILPFLLVISVVLTLRIQRSFEFYPKGDAVVLDHVSVTVNGETKEVSLPYTVRTPAARTPVTVTAEIPASISDVVYVKTVYCPLEVSLGSTLLTEMGDLKYYPSFMRDPATEVKFVPLPEDSAGQTLKLVYLSPYGRSSVVIHPPVIGKVGAVNRILFRSNVFTFGLGFMQIFIGILMIPVSVVLALKEKEIRAFFWLGLFTLFVGIWGVCENNLTLWIWDKPAVLYLLDFLGLECSPIPFVCFYRDIQGLEKSRIFHILSLISVAYPAVSLLLQLLGGPPLFATVRIFHVVAAAMFCVVLGVTIREYTILHDQLQERAIFSLGILIMSVFIEIANYYFHFIWLNTSFFNIGLALFIIFSWFISISNFTRTNAQKQQLEMEMRTMSVEAEEQKKHTLLIMENARETREQRHNLRQNLITIRGLAESGKTEELLSYIGTMIEAIPKAVRSYCENPTINAIISYYASVCEQEGIEFTARLDFPAKSSSITDVDLCTVFGNLLENALEACRRMSGGKRFIRVSCIRHLDTLTIAVSNSFDGKAKRSGDLFLSSKRKNGSSGIGLSSIRSTARKYHGDARFETEGSVFNSFVYLSFL